MANRLYRIYSDVDTRITYNDEGSQLANNLLPYIFSKEHVDIELNYVKNWVDIDNITQYTGFAGTSISSSAVVDNDYNHVDDGFLVADQSGVITSIEISGLDNIPLQTGFIQLVNSAGQSETVAYTDVSPSGNNFVFTVSATLVYVYVASDSSNVSDPALIKTINIDNSQKDVGIFTITLDANSLPYLRQIAGKASISSCQFEHQVKDDDPKLIFVSSFDFLCLNVRDDDGVIPPPDSGDYYTKVESDASFISRNSSNVDIGTSLDADDYFPVYNKTTGESERYKISDIATGTQVPPVQNTYTDIATMLADQGNQTLDYLQQAGTAFFKKLVASTVNISDYVEVGAQKSPIEGLYTTTGNMISDQSNQTADYIQKAGVEYYHYLGTTVGDITDYQLIGSGVGSGGIVDSVFGRQVVNVVAESGDYTAAQITETPTRKILTDVERTAIDLTNYTTTGVISGGEVIQNTSTTFDIAAGTGIILDYSDPTTITKTLITWNAEIGVSIPDISQTFTILQVTGDNTITKTSRGAVTTPQEKRSNIQLSAVLHASGVQIDGITLSHRPAYGAIDSTLDYISKNGIVNKGNLFKANGANVRIDRDSGTTTIPFINILNDLLAPVTKTDNAELEVLMFFGYQDGIGGDAIDPPSLDLDTDVYDDGSGTLASIPNNNYVTHRIVYFSDGATSGLQYGQVTYSTESEAVGAIYTETFVMNSLMSTGALTTYITIQEGETNLTNAIFTENKSGSGSGSTSDGVLTVNSGTDITVDNTDPQNPIINFTGSTGGNGWSSNVSKTGTYTILDGDLGSLIYLNSSVSVDTTFTLKSSPSDGDEVFICNQNEISEARLTVSDGVDDIIRLGVNDGVYKFVYSSVVSAWVPSIA